MGDLRQLWGGWTKTVGFYRCLSRFIGDTLPQPPLHSTSPPFLEESTLGDLITMNDSDPKSWGGVKGKETNYLWNKETDPLFGEQMEIWLGFTDLLRSGASLIKDGST